MKIREVSAHIATLGMWLERSKLEIVRGPAAGQVLYGRELVGGIDLHLVDAASGVDRVVVRVPRRTQDGWRIGSRKLHDTREGAEAEVQREMVKNGVFCIL